MSINIAKNWNSVLTALSASFLLLSGCNNNAHDADKFADDKKKQQSEATSETRSSSESKEKDDDEGGDGEAKTMRVVKVEKKRLDSELDLPGNLEAFQDVPIHARVEGYVSWIGVDRGSVVTRGQLLARITAPEVISKVKEAEAKVSSADAAYHQSMQTLDGMLSKQVEAQAKLDSDKLTYDRLTQASKTVGAIAQNEVDVAHQTVAADVARVKSIAAEVGAARSSVASQKENLKAAKSMRDSVKAMDDYLTIKAPFDGVITERNVHEGSMVATDQSRSTGVPMLRLQQKSRLRLVIAVPEASVAGIKLGKVVPFTVPAFAGKTFHGTIARPGFALNSQTRTMPVELDVTNANGDLEPGMFATVKWDVTRPYETLFLPPTAVAVDLSGTFVIQVKNGVCKRVKIVQGTSMGDRVEVTGPLEDGDEVALVATDEIKDGTKMVTKLAAAKEIKAASKNRGGGGE